MKIFDKITKTTRVSAEELAQIVAREFITGASEDFLKKVEKTAKGGSAIMGAFKILTTEDGKFSLFVDKGPEFLIWLKHKDSAVIDELTGEKWQLESAKLWPKFYEEVKKYIDLERKKH